MSRSLLASERWGAQVCRVTEDNHLYAFGIPMEH